MQYTSCFQSIYIFHTHSPWTTLLEDVRNSIHEECNEFLGIIVLLDFINVVNWIILCFSWWIESFDDMISFIKNNYLKFHLVEIAPIPQLGQGWHCNIGRRWWKDITCLSIIQWITCRWWTVAPLSQIICMGATYRNESGPT